MLVSMNPGPMAFTRIPTGARLMAANLVSIHTPALETLYESVPAAGPLAAIDAMVMIDSPTACRLAADCIASNVPVRFTSSTSCQSSNGNSLNMLTGSGAISAVTCRFESLT